MVEQQPYQCVIRPNHLPYEATSVYVVLQISTDFHLELRPSVFKRICAELQKHRFYVIYNVRSNKAPTT